MARFVFQQRQVENSGLIASKPENSLSAGCADRVVGPPRLLPLHLPQRQSTGAELLPLDWDPFIGHIERHRRGFSKEDAGPKRKALGMIYLRLREFLLCVAHWLTFFDRGPTSFALRE
jgi:hypothetical protein